MNGTSVIISSSHVTKLHEAQYSLLVQLIGQLYPLIKNNTDVKIPK